MISQLFKGVVLYRLSQYIGTGARTGCTKIKISTDYLKADHPTSLFRFHLTEIIDFKYHSVVLYIYKNFFAYRFSLFIPYYPLNL